MDCGRPVCESLPLITAKTIRCKGYVKNVTSLVRVYPYWESATQPNRSDSGHRSKNYLGTVKNEVKLPCIIHWHQQHFIVVYRIRKKRPPVDICFRPGRRPAPIFRKTIFTSLAANKNNPGETERIYYRDSPG